MTEHLQHSYSYSLHYIASFMSFSESVPVPSNSRTIFIGGNEQCSRYCALHIFPGTAVTFVDTLAVKSVYYL